MLIIKKLGGYKKTANILKNNGYQSKNPYIAVLCAKHRGEMSKEMSFVLLDYCQKNNIPVSIEDFKGK